jgi:cellulose synthase/poly-beta-1,6-N-acetylglucosamine synthase-like glycosyltransferase
LNPSNTSRANRSTRASIEQLAVNVSAPAPSAPEVRYTKITMDPHRRLGPGGLPLPVTFDCLHRHNLRRAKVLVVITAYNETWEDLKGTLHGVLDNIGSLAGMRNYSAMMRGSGSNRSLGDAPQRPSLRTFSNSSVSSDGLGTGMGTVTVGGSSVKFDKRIEPCSDWLSPEELVVMVVFDGREKMSGTLFGSWDKDGCVLTDGHKAAMAAGAKEMQEMRARDNISADSDLRDLHMLEFQYRPEVARTMQFSTPINLIFAIKERNGGKLNSHVWAFRGLAPFLQPRYLLLLDAGTIAGPTSILRLIADMEADEDIGGSCGEIVVDYGQRSIFAPIIMAQAFEYVSANAIDKAFESVCGCVNACGDGGGW